MTTQAFLSKPRTVGVIWGLIGGVALIITTIVSTNGYVQIAPYFFILFGSVLTAKYSSESHNKFIGQFQSAFLSFVIGSMFLYAYILMVLNPGSGITLTGHLWRFGAVVLMGLISSFIASFLVRLSR